MNPCPDCGGLVFNETVMTETIKRRTLTIQWDGTLAASEYVTESEAPAVLALVFCDNCKKAQKQA